MSLDYSVTYVPRPYPCNAQPIIPPDLREKPRRPVNSDVGPLMDDLPLVGWLVLAPFVLCWVGGVVSFGYMAYYLVKTMARYRADRQWGKFVGFSFLVPAFFTEEGNVYRVQLVKWIGRFLFFLTSGALIGLAVKFATGH